MLTYVETLLMPECKMLSKHGHRSAIRLVGSASVLYVKIAFNVHCILCHDVYRVMGIDLGFAATDKVECLRSVSRPRQILLKETDIIMYWTV